MQATGAEQLAVVNVMWADKINRDCMRRHHWRRLAACPCPSLLPLYLAQLLLSCCRWWSNVFVTETDSQLLYVMSMMRMMLRV